MGKTTIINQIGRWAPPIIWAVIIFLLSSYNTLPGPDIIWWDFIVKKGAHMFMYGGLFFWIQRALNFEKKESHYLLAMMITIAYAFTDEFHQSFIIGRTALLSDIGYDFIGASMVMLKLKKLI
jgi:VanZ family protein